MGSLNVKGIVMPGGSDDKNQQLMQWNGGLKITDLNQFCLEHIFMYLDLEDLASVADANKELRESTMAPFAQKYGRNWIQLRQTDQGGPTTFPEAHQLTICNLKLMFQTLRCFGPMISKLKMFYLVFHQADPFKNYYRLLGYMTEYCADTLANVDFSPAKGFERIEKPFANVEEVTITKSELETKCLNAVFPKMQRLIFPISYSENDFSLPIADHFPNLHHLEFDMDKPADGCKEAVIEALRLNSHLKSLRICIPNFRYLEEIKEHLQSIENLEVHMRVQIRLKRAQFNCNSIRFSGAKRFYLQFDTYNNDTDLPKIPFEFDQLKEFVLSGPLIDYNDFYNDFLRANPGIEKLTLDYERLSDITNPKKLKEMLPSLAEITFCGDYYNYFRVDRIIKDWANELKTVDKFIFGRTEAIEQVKAQPIDQWHTVLSVNNKTEHVITLERIKTVNPLFDHKIPRNHKFVLCNCDPKNPNKSN